MSNGLRLAAAAVFCVGTAAQASVIDFEGFDHGDRISSISSTDGAISASVSAIGGIREAWIFDTTQSNTDDPDLQDPFYRPGEAITGANQERPGNVLIIQERFTSRSDTDPDDNASGGSITFNFAQAVNFLGFDIFDDARITVTSNTGDSTTRSVPDLSGRNEWDDFNIRAGTFMNLTSLTFNFNGNSGAIDDLRFELSAVPVPASLPLLLVGLGGLGYLSRRKRKSL